MATDPPGLFGQVLHCHPFALVRLALTTPDAVSDLLRRLALVEYALTVRDVATAQYELAGYAEELLHRVQYLSGYHPDKDARHQRDDARQRVLHTASVAGLNHRATGDVMLAAGLLTPHDRKPSEQALDRLDGNETTAAEWERTCGQGRNL